MTAIMYDANGGNLLWRHWDEGKGAPESLVPAGMGISNRSTMHKINQRSYSSTIPLIIRNLPISEL